MRWFKHLADSHEDERLAVILAEAGLEGYGFWWMMLEVIAKKVDESDNCSVTFPLEKWCNLFGLRPQKFNRLLRLFEDKKSFPEETPLLFVKRNGKLITVSCPNLLKYRDEYSRKKARSSENVRRVSGQNPDNVRPKDTETESEINNEKSNRRMSDAIRDRTGPTAGGGDEKVLPLTEKKLTTDKGNGSSPVFIELPCKRTSKSRGTSQEAHDFSRGRNATSSFPPSMQHICTSKKRNTQTYNRLA